MIRRSTRLALAASLALVSGLVVGADPASAYPPETITSHWDVSQAHPGDTVNLTVTFTNPEAVDVVFVYLNFIPRYDMIFTGVGWTYGACTGETTDCPIHPIVPVAPGATRTLTQSFHVGSNSACGGDATLVFRIYNYFESAAGNVETGADTLNLPIVC
jgi:hypothetical protein